MVGILALGIFFTGCSKKSSSSSLKIEMPKPKYTKIGYDVKTYVDGDDVKVTYALLGFKDDEIIHIYIDQIEKTLGKE